MGGVVIAVLGLVTLMAWALASAPGSAPDDNYHLSSIWCADGVTAQCGDDPAEPTRMRPPNEVSGASCFSQDSDKSAACQNDYSTELIPGGAYGVGNWNGGQYPPLFYATMNNLITGELYSSVFLMRTFNGLLLVGLLSLVVANLPRRLRALGVVPVVVTSVPLGLSLMTSTNPTSWTVAGIAALWPALYGAFEVKGRPRVLLLLAALLATLVAAGSRGDGALFAIVAIGMVLVMRFKELARNPLIVGVAVLAGVIAAVFFLTSGQSGVVSSGGFGVGPTKSLAWHQVAIANLQALPNLWVGSLGFGFMASAGWLDTPFPALVGFSATAVWAVLVFGGWREMFWSKAFAVGGIAAAMVVYPLVMLGLSGLRVGDSFQPRYLLPLLIILTGASLLSQRTVRLRLSAFQAASVVASLSIAQAIALHTQIRRYVTGLDEGGWSLDRGREWWWDIPISATTVWVLGSLAFGLLCWLVLRPSAFGVDDTKSGQVDDVRSTSPAGEDELTSAR